MTCEAGWDDAIECVDAKTNKGKDVFDLADAEEMDGTIRVGVWERGVDDFIHFFICTTETATNGCAEEGTIFCVFGGNAAKVRVYAALDDAVEGLDASVGADELFEGTIAPADTHFHGLGGVVFCHVVWGAFVELHQEVCAEFALDFHGAFGGEFDEATVNVRTECAALFRDFEEIAVSIVGFIAFAALDFIGHCAFAEGKDLEAAAVGEHGAVPTGKFMETAHFFDQVCAGLEHEVIGVGEDDICFGFMHLRGRKAFDGGFGGAEDVVWRFDIAMRRFKRADTRPGFRVFVCNVECEIFIVRHDRFNKNPAIIAAAGLVKPLFCS